MMGVRAGRRWTVSGRREGKRRKKNIRECVSEKRMCFCNVLIRIFLVTKKLLSFFYYSFIHAEGRLREK
jgi:hypothetical protein